MSVVIGSRTRDGSRQRPSPTARRARRASGRTTIVLADDQSLVRGGIRCLVEKEDDFQVVGEVADGLKAVAFVARLKPRREREVLLLASEGHSSARIASHLSIGRRTAESHRASLMHKLRFRNQTDLIRYVLERAILGPLS